MRLRVELAVISLRHLDFRGRHRSPRLASPGSTTEVEANHPLLSCTEPRYRTSSAWSNEQAAPGMPGQPGQSSHNAATQAERPMGPPQSADPTGRPLVVMRRPPRALAVAEECARGGRPAGSGPVLWPGLPRDEARFLITTGPQPPKRHPSHCLRRRNATRRLLPVVKKQVIRRSSPGLTALRPARRTWPGISAGRPQASPHRGEPAPAVGRPRAQPCRLLRNVPASEAAEVSGDRVNSRIAKATPP